MRIIFSRHRLLFLGLFTFQEKELASFLASSYKSKQNLAAKTNSLFVKYLGHTGGNKIYDYYLSLVSSCNNPNRKINKLKSTKALYPFVDDLEKKFIREA